MSGVFRGTLLVIAVCLRFALPASGQNEQFELLRALNAAQTERSGVDDRIAAAMPCSRTP